MLIWNNKRWL